MSVLLEKLSDSQVLSSNVKLVSGKKVSLISLAGYTEEDVEAFTSQETENAMVLIPSDWLDIKEKMDQDWLINLPKGKGQETLYSTTFFWTAKQESIQQMLDFAMQKHWAIYTEVEGKLCLLVISSKVGVDVKIEEVLDQLV